MISVLCGYNQYPLPTIDFVGGETQELAFHAYYYSGKQPFSLARCTANFSIVSANNKMGAPILSKDMRVSLSDGSSVDNVLTVTLTPSETVNLYGKYIYEIQIRDSGGDVEIPKQGVLYITNNINKGFIRP